MRIIFNRSKPNDLPEPCKSCEKWSPVERKIHDISVLTNPYFKQEALYCKYHPLYSSPDLSIHCPYRNYVGKTVIELYCDKCGKIIKRFSTDEGFNVAEIEYIAGNDVITLCPECKIRENKEIREKDLPVIKRTQK